MCIQRIGLNTQNKIILYDVYADQGKNGKILKWFILKVGWKLMEWINP